MRLLTVLGDPVAHSLSPTFQNAALRHLGLDAVYLALQVRSDDLAGLLRGIARAGGGGNVTLPHKERAAQTVEVRHPAVERTGACNTFWLEEGRIHGDNTDVEGVRQAVQGLLGSPPQGARVLLLGAGGSARAVVDALVEDGVEEIWIQTRSPERAQALSEAMGRGRTRVVPPPASGARPDRLAMELPPIDLVINNTPLGLGPHDPFPLGLDEIPQGNPAFFDLVYAPAETPWVRALRGEGHRACDGGEMLIQQGAAAFSRWWQRPAPIEVMRRALDAARRG
jgi:shikimate dehydrogenase